MSEDSLRQLDLNLGEILDRLEEIYPNEGRSDPLQVFIECCREFVVRGPIANFPDWLAELSSRGRAIAPAVQQSRMREVADSLAKLIEDVSYGEVDDEKLSESLRILKFLDRP